MQHWILNVMSVQTVVEKLERNMITLKYAKNYFSAYGLEIKGNTKERFIKNLIKAAKG